jgi:hypothetical protein
MAPPTPSGTPTEFIDSAVRNAWRPVTRADCLDEARPCPWVACKHHLLLEVASCSTELDPRPPSLRLNRRTGKNGRREGLSSSDAAALVRVWIDDAFELLVTMEYTCVLDVVRDWPYGVPPAVLARILGVSAQHVRSDVQRLVARHDVRELLQEHAVQAGWK